MAMVEVLVVEIKEYSLFVIQAHSVVLVEQLLPRVVTHTTRLQLLAHILVKDMPWLGTQK
jgi:hypothetical protein